MPRGSGHAASFVILVIAKHRPDKKSVDAHSINLNQSLVKKGTPMEQPKKLLDQVRDVIRVKHYSIRTEESYVGWIRRYILFHDKRHPQDIL